MELHGASGGVPKPIRQGRLKTDRLLRELSSEEDSDEIHVSHSSPSDSSKPWMREFNQYIQVRDEVPEGMTLHQETNDDTGKTYKLLTDKKYLKYIQLLQMV